MKTECVKDKFVEALSKAEKIATKNQNLPILSCVCITAKKGEILIRATNLDVGIEVLVPAKVIEEGVVIVSGSVLLSFITQVKNEKNISFEIQGGGLKVSLGRFSSLIKTQPLNDEFPTIPKTESDVFVTINPSVVVKGLKSVFYAASNSQVKQELSSVFMSSNEDSLVFVSTDSFRLAEKTIKHKGVRDVPSVILPVKNVPDVIRVLDGLTEDIQIYFSKTQISITSSHMFFVSRVIEGSFPDYHQIIPKGSTTEVVMLTRDITDALKTSNIFSDKFNQIKIQVSPKDRKFSLETNNSSVGEYKASVDSSISGESIDVSFNSKYILDSFQSIETDSVSFSFGGVNKPLVIKGVSDKSFLYLVMPMNK